MGGRSRNANECAGQIERHGCREKDGWSRSDGWGSGLV